jgi:hypothetical protein
LKAHCIIADKYTLLDIACTATRAIHPLCNGIRIIDVFLNIQLGLLNLITCIQLHIYLFGCNKHKKRNILVEVVTDFQSLKI